ncbi:Ger(x)C family spore germination protein [Clostridium thermarum]|uniref:Ger(x)C family spore germination protein n=1 Tax=Clostridium thermarum TaxID=1716543 RepID=UPI001121E024|nr:Ger(x)C family spore germination protein [Clostridium thermarum]
MKKLLVLFLACSTMILGGCWDKVEIDRNAFASTIGIDVGKDIKNKKALEGVKPDEPFGERKLERLNVTFAFPDISKYNSQNPQISSDKYVKTPAYSMEDALSNAVMKSSRAINLGHAELLLLSQEILQYPDQVEEVVDFLSRSPHTNRTMYVMMTEGDVEEFFDFKLEMENTIGAYITGLMENSKKNAAILPITLNDFLILLSDNGNAIIPALRIDKEKNEMLIDGIAIIKGYKVIGVLSLQDTTVIEMLRGQLTSGKKVIYKDRVPVDFEIDGLKRRLKFSESDGKLFFNIDIDIEGKIKQYKVDKEIFNDTTLDEFQEYFSRSLSEEGEKVARRIQREYGVDIFGLREYVIKFMPDTWKKIQGDWEKSFKDAVINVNVDVDIRRIGTRK